MPLDGLVASVLDGCLGTGAMELLAVVVVAVWWAVGGGVVVRGEADEVLAAGRAGVARTGEGSDSGCNGGDGSDGGDDDFSCSEGSCICSGFSISFVSLSSSSSSSESGRTGVFLSGSSGMSVVSFSL